MFRKGIVTFFDDRSGLGYIELAADHQRVIFKLENFSNTSILPQIGERVKCIVIEEHGEFLAKFIVRLDHKNYVADKNKPLSSHYAYDENSFENVRNSRKILKKRRISPEHIALEKESLAENTLTDQHVVSVETENESARNTNAFATQSTKTIQTQIIAIQPQIIKGNSYTEAFVEAFKPIQVEERQSVVDEVPIVDTHQQVSNAQILEPVETIQEVEITESIQPVQVEAVQSVVEEVPVTEINESVLKEEIVEPVETVQEVEATESIQPVQVEVVQSVVEEVSVVDIHQQASNEQIFEPIETVQEEEIIESVQSIQVEAVQDIVDDTSVTQINESALKEEIVEQVETIQAVEIPESVQPIQVKAAQTIEDIPAVDAFSATSNKPESKINDVDRQKRLLERQLLEKSMNLTAFQKFMQRMKVKFFYSKRKQAQIKPETPKRLHFNPWVLVAGVVLLGGINFSFYAHDRYEEYKSDNLLKLQQYENQQKEEIKRQKQEATAR